MAKRLNPIEEFELEKTATERRAVDLQLYHHWNDNGRKPEDLEPIIRRYQPFVFKTMKKMAPNMDPAAMQSVIQNKLIEAVHSYDPGYGTALSTHLIGHARSAARWVSDHGQSGRAPEKKQRAIGPVQIAQEDLRDQLGRDPTHMELASYVNQMTGKKWKPKDIAQIQRIQGIKDVPMSASGEGSTIQQPRHMEMAGGMLFRQEVGATAPPAKRDLYLQVYDHMWGVNGAPLIQDTGALARRLGVRDSDISRIKTFFQDIGKRYL